MGMSMSSNLKQSAQRVQEYLNKQGFNFEVKEFADSTRTSQEAADCVGCSVSQIAKSLVFRNKANDSAVLVIASGSNRVDVKKIQKATGLKLGRADGNFVKEKVGFAIGGVPPVAHNEPLETFLDPDLKKHETIWAAAGTPFAVFKLKPDQLESLTSGRWIDLAEDSAA